MQHWIVAFLIVAASLAPCLAIARQQPGNPPLASGLYNFQGVPFDDWTLTGVLDPRVTGMDIYCTWTELEPRAGQPRWDWLERTCEPWWRRGKQVALRVASGGHRAQGTPEWVFTRGVRRVTAGAPFADFEHDTDGFELLNGAQRVDTDDPPAAGRVVVRSLRPGGILRSPVDWSLPSGEQVTVSVDIRCRRSGRLALCLYPPSGKGQRLTTWKLKAGASGPLEYTFQVPFREGMRFQLDGDRTLGVDVDNILLTRRWDCPETYPVYWQPAFRVELESLVRRLAQRYAGQRRFAFFSVNGIGRWDEAMINTGDSWNDTSLKRQWLAQGYTPEGYLDHLIWAMDVWRRHFPHDHLALMTAYAFNDPQWTPWLCYRMCEEAAKRGIHIKQNGWSGKYSQWDNSFQFSWAPARLGVRPIYEPGTGPSGMELETTEGYMLRAFLDDSSLLSWYVPDLRDPAQQGGIDLAAMGIGHRWNTWFTRLRSYAVSYQKRPDRVTEHRNLFMGITQFQDPDWLQRSLGGGQGAGVYQWISGEWALRTDVASGNRYLYLDLDDRAVWAGLQGASLAIRYLDQGNQPFFVEGYDHRHAEWRTLFEIPRRDSGQWIVFRSLLPVWNTRHPMDLTNNEWKDLRVAATAQDVVLTDMQLQFLRDVDWREEPSVSREPAEGVHRLTPGESLQVTLQRPDELTASIHIPMWRPDRSACTVEVDVAGDGEEAPTVTRQFAMVSDGEWLRIPWPVAARTAHVTLRVVSGEAGWRLTAQGQPAWRMCRWQVLNSTAAAGVEIERSADAPVILQVDRPWCALRLHVASALDTGITIVIERWLDAWQPVTKLAVSPPQASSIFIPTGPLPPGRYRILMKPDDPVRHAQGLGASLEPVYLVSSNGEASSWDGTEQPHGLIVEQHKWSDPDWPGTARDVPLSRPYQPTEGSHVVFRMTNSSPAPVARLFWRGAGELWDASRSVDVPVLPNDSQPRSYTARLPRSTAAITELRLELVNFWPESGHARLHWMELRDPLLMQAEWTTTERQTNGHWNRQFGLQEMTPEQTGWRGQWRGDMGSVRAVSCLSTSGWGRAADASHVVRLRWTPPAGAACVQWRWRKDGQPCVVSAPVLASGQTISTLLPVGTHPDWTAGAVSQQVALLGWPPDGVPSETMWNAAELLETHPVATQPLDRLGAPGRMQWVWRPALQAGDDQMLRLDLSPGSGYGVVQIRWKTSSGSGEQTIPIYKGMSTIWLPVGEHPQWRGSITSIRASVSNGSDVLLTGWGVYTGQVVDARPFGASAIRGDLAGWTCGGVFHSPRVPATGGLRVSASAGGTGWFERTVQIPDRPFPSVVWLRIRAHIPTSTPVGARLIIQSASAADLQTAFSLSPEGDGQVDTLVPLSAGVVSAGALKLRLEIDVPNAMDCTLDQILLGSCDGYTSHNTNLEDR